jgi:hypothetical protein
MSASFDSNASYSESILNRREFRVSQRNAMAQPQQVGVGLAWQEKSRKSDILYDAQTKPAVIIDGPNAGSLLYVCRDDKCPVHARMPRYQPTPQEKAPRTKEVLAERIEKQTRVSRPRCHPQKASVRAVASRGSTKCVASSSSFST